MINRYANTGPLTVIVFVALLGVSAMPKTCKADDEFRKTPFTEQSIKGAWGFSGNFGMIVSPDNPDPVPSAAVGRVLFDGKGGCSVTTTVNVNGTIVGPMSSDTCTYSVNPDGTGTSVAEFPGDPFNEPASVSFVIVDRKKEIRFMNTTSVVAGFIAKRQ